LYVREIILYNVGVNKMQQNRKVFDIRQAALTITKRKLFTNCNKLITNYITG